MTGMYQDTPYPYHARPFPSRWGFFHSPMPNPYGSYTPNQVNQMPDPPLLSDGKWWFQSRLQIGGWVIYPPEWWRVSAPSGMWGKPGPSGQPLPYPVDYPGPFVVSDPSEISSAWPKTGSVTHTVLPWPQWRPGLAWRDIPARNRLRAQFPDIRQKVTGLLLIRTNPVRSFIVHQGEMRRRANDAPILLLSFGGIEQLRNRGMRQVSIVIAFPRFMTLFPRTFGFPIARATLLRATKKRRSFFVILTASMLIKRSLILWKTKLRMRLLVRDLKISITLRSG